MGQLIHPRSYRRGAAYVPRTGEARLHEGEAVVPTRPGSRGDEVDAAFREFLKKRKKVVAARGGK